MPDDKKESQKENEDAVAGTPAPINLAEARAAWERFAREYGMAANSLSVANSAMQNLAERAQVLAEILGIVPQSPRQIRRMGPVAEKPGPPEKK